MNRFPTDNFSQRRPMNLKAPTEPDLGSQYRKRIDESLRRYLDFDSGCPDRLREAIEYSLLSPGKRLRPLLVLFAAEACGGDIQQALPAAAAVEMIHSYSLVHDDLPAMDDDDLRRGRPTCHKQFDEATAILVGDALLAKAFEVLAAEIKPAERAAQCCAELARASGASRLVGGQADDLDALLNDKSIARLESIHRRKTGALFLASLRLGAIVSDATPDQANALDEYGQSLGLAFQIVDDLLDVSGTEGQVGKRLGKDIERDKMTYPSLLGQEASRERVEALIDQACQAIACFGQEAETLRELALFVRRRNN